MGLEPLKMKETQSFEKSETTYLVKKHTSQKTRILKSVVMSRKGPVKMAEVLW
jgi:hypothetical protein